MLLALCLQPGACFRSRGQTSLVPLVHRACPPCPSPSQHQLAPSPHVLFASQPTRMAAASCQLVAFSHSSRSTMVQGVQGRATWM